LSAKRVSFGCLYTSVRGLIIFTDLLQELADMEVLVLSICF
jgi:hypothetical protein